MKTSFIMLAVFVGIHSATAQSLVISSFSQNGVLVCSGLQTGTVASVEWASSLSGPWQTNWASLQNINVNSNSTITVSVPMFYRVRGVAATNNPTYTADGMALISAGIFTMGDNLDGESDAIPTNVYVSAFYIDTNLVSLAQWHSVAIYGATNGYVLDAVSSGIASNYPAQYPKWYDALKWCNARSQQAGLTPVYYTDSEMTQIYTNGEIDAVYPNWAANGYRLPTEAEWEKAARGGSVGLRFPWGNTISESRANYYGDTADYTYDLGPNGLNAAASISYGSTPVSYFAPNAYGIYDMAGNVLEWCWDWYAGPSYPAGSPYLGGSDPRGPASGSARVARGGDYDSSAYFSRCAARDDVAPGAVAEEIGFRCVRRQ
jgi:formylglycine-generating enzyme required for sulfatase activity